MEPSLATSNYTHTKCINEAPQHILPWTMSTTAQQQHTSITSRIPVRTGGSGSPLIAHNSPHTRLLSTSTGAGSPKSSAGADALPPTFRDDGSPSIGYRRAGGKIASPKIGESSPSSTFRRAGGTAQQPKRAQLAFPLPESTAHAAASEVYQPPSQQIDSTRHLPPLTNTDTDIRPLSRSESNESINSVILAHALGLGLASPYTGEGERLGRGTEGGVGGDGERLINDELPPFLISEDDDRSRIHIAKGDRMATNGSTGGLSLLPVQNGGMAQAAPSGSLEDGYPRTASRGQKDQSPVNQNSEGVAGRNSGTLVPQSTILDNPGPENQHRSTGTPTSARRLKPSATSAVKPAQSQKTKSLTPRSASAQELGRFASPSTASKPNHTASPSSITPTQSPATTKNRNGGILNSSSTRDFSHHYPAEAYLVPQITKYGPTEGSMWDDTVIPTIAKRLHGASGPRERGRVGLGFFETENDTTQLDAEREEEKLRHGEGGEVDEDNLVAEWTADGRPVKIVRVDASKAKSGDRRRPQEAEAPLGGERDSGRSVQERQEEDVSVRFSSHSICHDSHKADAFLIRSRSHF
ncbi:hypothetical protein QFC22_002426 [Naganishia vaughanmartiniae]|uniref:Uncharacterized protein n=1 Tax=Naganishia vaughanmartiniae TaxID=1424756 RepID=A0ACC2XDX1_9TREE|nr:hypothetical protein QFC22_002426 [Naganishia vaughanmartiniae]